MNQTSEPADSLSKMHSVDFIFSVMFNSDMAVFDYAQVNVEEGIE